MINQGIFILSFSPQDTEFIRNQALRAISSNRAPGLHFAAYFFNLNVPRFEKEMLVALKTQHPTLLKQIAEKKAIDDTLQGELKEAIKSFKRTFK